MFHGSITALITPFQKDGTLDLEAFAELVEWQLAEGTEGFVCFGTTGESSTLSNNEKLDLLRTCIDVTSNKVPVIANTGTNNTLESIELTQAAKDLGADACLVIAPYYNKPPQEGCFQHFQKIAEVGLGLIVYHHPGRTGVTLSQETLERLSNTPNIEAIKEASGSLPSCDIPVLSGDDSSTFSFLQHGATGSISVVSNLFPREHRQAVSLALQNEFEQSKAAFVKLSPIIETLSLEVNPQPIKYSLSLIGKCKPIWRLPMIPPSLAVRKNIEGALKDLNQLDESRK